MSYTDDFDVYTKNIQYSAPYDDDGYPPLGQMRYRHVTVPRKQLLDILRKYKDNIDAFSVAKIVEKLTKNEYLTEEEWRKLGLHMSHGWEHYTYLKDRFVMGFRRPIS